MLGAAIVYPGRREVIRLMPEPILKQDGDTKHDCERNALKRSFTQVKGDQPHLRVIATLDALYADAPVFRNSRSAFIPWIICAEPDHNAFLFEQVGQLAEQAVTEDFEVVGFDRVLWERQREIFHQFQASSMQAIFTAMLSIGEPPIKALWDS